MGALEELYAGTVPGDVACGGQPRGGAHPAGRFSRLEPYV